MSQVSLFRLVILIMRPTPRRFLKTIFFISLICFTIVNFNLYITHKSINRADELSIEHKYQGYVKNNFVNFSGTGRQESVGINVTQVITASANIHSNLSDLKNAVQFKNFSVRHNEFKNKTLTPFDFDEYVRLDNDLEAIHDYITQANKEQHIRNLDKFDLSSSPYAIVIVVQVHDRANYLRYLIDSFQTAAGIEQVLLIFSHDVFDDDVNQLIYSITFCPVLQIFYPVPIQLFPHEFPGEDPKDCPRDANREKAVQLNCKNMHWSDKYGHYREAKYSQTKHHWFWKINHIFDYLDVTKHFNGPVLFVEEDHYVTPDFLPVLQNMYRFGETACKDCSIYTLGTYLKRPTYGVTARKGFWASFFGSDTEENKPKTDGVDIMTWQSSKHNMGMAMTRSVWEKIKACTQVFCTYDDYNWDWSLQYVSDTCVPNKLRCMLLKSPRIFHIGSCGVHHKGKNCDVTASIAPIKDLIKNNANSLFPDVLEVQGYPRTPTKQPKPNGGWGDFRDQQLCKDFNSTHYH